MLIKPAFPGSVDPIKKLAGSSEKSHSGPSALKIAGGIVSFGHDGSVSDDHKAVLLVRSHGLIKG
jgi:hypothetical protein